MTPRGGQWKSCLTKALLSYSGGRTKGVVVGTNAAQMTLGPEVGARAIVKVSTHFHDPEVIAEVCKNLGEAMRGLDIEQIALGELLVSRGAE